MFYPDVGLLPSGTPKRARDTSVDSHHPKFWPQRANALGARSLSESNRQKGITWLYRFDFSAALRGFPS